MEAQRLVNDLTDTVCAPRPDEVIVQTVETTSSLEGRRCRFAQYSGQAAKLSINGSRFFGRVGSVREDRSGNPQRWIVTIHPTVVKPPIPAWRYSSRPQGAWKSK